MRICEDYIKDRLKDECVVIPVGDTSKYTHGVFTLNETGERIYDLIEEGKSPDGIVEVLSKEYSSDRSEIEFFVDSFISKLRDAGIVVDE